jgi:hypothetical protein
MFVGVLGEPIFVFKGDRVAFIREYRHKPKADNGNKNINAPR